MEQKNSCASLIKQIHDALEKQANSAMRPLELTMSQFGMLMALHGASDHQVPLKELERQFHVAQSTAAGIVVRLEQKGLVSSFSSQEDRRIKIVRITQEGLERCRSADEHMEETEHMILAGLTDTERDRFHALLQKVHNSL